MADRWHTFEPSQFFPDPLQRAVSALDKAYGALEKTASVVDKALKVAKKLATKASVNPGEVALKAIMAEIDKYITGLSSNTTAHAIIIPIRKKVIRRTKGAAAIEDFLSPNEPAYAYVQRAKDTAGGTAAFYNTLIESLADEGDICRPAFPSNYAVTGACVLAGAETLQDLQVPLRLFTTLFAGNMRMPPAATALPVVQNLRVLAAPVRGGVGAVLRWEPLMPVSVTPLLTGERVVAEEIFLIRVRQDFTRGWFAWSDLFNVEPLESVTDLPDKGDVKVVARIRNNGFVVSYIDTQLLSDKDTYYYTACVRYSLNGVVQPMGSLSNVARVTRSAPQPSSRLAVPPDWYATKSLTELFPPLQEAINTIRAGASRLTSITSVNSGGQQLIQQTIDQIDRLLQQYRDTIAKTAEITERLQLLTAEQSPAGLHATTLTTSAGGMDAWFAELARRLSDTSDPSTPVISNDAVVVGFVIVAGAPRLPELTALITLFEMFFGRHPRNPLAAPLENTTAPRAQVPAAPRPIVGYTDAMLPSETPTC